MPKLDSVTSGVHQNNNFEVGIEMEFNNSNDG